MGLIAALLGIRLVTDSVNSALSTFATEDLPANQAAALDALIRGKGWTIAGDVQLDSKGTPQLPAMPPVPGIRRYDIFAGQEAHEVHLASVENLHESLIVASERDQEVLTELQGLIAAGQSIRFSYLDRASLGGVELDLATIDNRLWLTQALGERAQKTGGWELVSATGEEIQSE